MIDLINPRRYIVEDLDVLDGLVQKDLEGSGIEIQNEIFKDTQAEGCFIKLTVPKELAFEFRQVSIEKGWKQPLSVGLDPSATPAIEVFRGNTRYLIIKPITVAAIHDVEAVAHKINNLSRFVVLASDQVFEAITESAEKILVDHVRLQRGLSNTLKHLKEATMTLDTLKDVIKILVEYDYKFDPENPDKSVIILKDGPLLSNGEFKIANVLQAPDEEISPIIREYRDLYFLVKEAAKLGIPIIGVTKDAQQKLLANLCGISWNDYSIVKMKAGGKVKYAYLPPIEKYWKDSELKLHFYYVYIERGFSCLRLETLGNIVPHGLKDWTPVIEDVIRMIMTTAETLDYNGQLYKVPLAIVRTDQISRDLVNNKKDVAIVKADEFLKKCPRGAKVRLGLHIINAI